MNIEELKTKLDTIVQMETIGVNVFFILKNENGEGVLKKADIRNDATSEIISSLKISIQEIKDNEDISVINLSAADDRSSVIYEYDLESRPSTFDFFEEIDNNRVDYFSFQNNKVFSFNEDKLSSIDGYIICVGDEENYILIYRKNFSVNLFKRNKIYLIKGDETQFTTMKDDFLRLDAKIDFFKVDNSVFIKNVDVLEKFYEFHQIIVTEATNSINRIQGLNLVENVEVLNERVDDTAFARKLTKVSTTSPVFTLPKSTILHFIRGHRLLANVFRYAENGNIVLDTKKSQNLFVRLLNDDFLHSELTGSDYLTPAKDKLE